MRFSPASLTVPLIGLFLGACVSVQEEHAFHRTLPEPPHPRLHLAPGASEVRSMHFVVQGHDSQRLREVSQIAEDTYRRIKDHTGLSFPAGPEYAINLYMDKTEFLEKTRLPNSSVGITTFSAVYTYDDPKLLPRVLREQLVRLLFSELMGKNRRRNLWIEEGLVLFEELQFLPDSARGQKLIMHLQTLRKKKLPLEKLMMTPPNDMNSKIQSASLIRFMLNEGGKWSFKLLLRDLSEAQDFLFPTALRRAFPAWSDLASLEFSWRRLRGLPD